MSLKVETLYSVPYAQTTETIQAPEFWNAYSLSTPTQNEGYVQAYMHVNGMVYNGIVSPYTSGTSLGVYPLPMYDTYAYTADGRVTGTIVSDFSSGNFPHIRGYYWDANRQQYRNFHNSAPTQYAFEFWNPADSSYHNVGVSYKLRDEHDVLFNWPTLGVSKTCSGYQFYPPSGNYPPTAVKTDDLYFTFLDGSGTNRYVCDEYLTWSQNTSPSLEVSGYKDSFNPYASVISYGLNIFQPGAPDPDVWTHYATSSDEASRAYPIILGVSRNMDDPNKSWVGTLAFGVQNKPLWMLGDGTQVGLSRIRQTKGAYLNDTPQGPPTDDENLSILIPERYGPFGNWLVRLQPVAPLLIQNFPIQQRIYTVNKSIEVSFDNSPPGPTINP